MRIQCPNCKRSISLTTNQIANRQSKITCPGCRRDITIQSDAKKIAGKDIKKFVSKLKLK